MEHAATLSALLRRAEGRLAAVGVESARLDAELLLARIVGTDRSGLYARLGDPCAATVAERLDLLLARRAQREPLAYILGYKEFYSLELHVDPSVLIPRPETEHLVDVALGHLADRAYPRICDVGTGSGCVAVALARALPAATIVASDISRPALRVAQRNAERHAVAGRILFVGGSLLDSFVGSFDAIVSNPPYLCPGDQRSPELDWEPQSALAAGPMGLDAIVRLIAAAPALLAPGGLLAVEIGAGQDTDAMALARAAGLESVTVQPDLAGIPRVLVGHRGRFPTA